MDYYYNGDSPCRKCDGERGNTSKGFAWTRPKDNSTPWWPTVPCNLCGGTGHDQGSYITVDEFVERNIRKLDRMKKKLQVELAKLESMGVKP